MTHLIYLSLGSNLGDRETNLRDAVEALSRRLSVTAVSALYETAPVGVVDQPAFLNLAVAAETDSTPGELLHAIKETEYDLGRRPTFRWGPRIVDIDILLYDDLRLETPVLTIPHPEMANRAFVLVPLAEIAPNAVHPVTGLTVVTLRDRRPDLASVRPFGNCRTP